MLKNCSVLKLSTDSITYQQTGLSVRAYSRTVWFLLKLHLQRLLYFIKRLAGVDVMICKNQSAFHLSLVLDPSQTVLEVATLQLLTIKLFWGLRNVTILKLFQNSTFPDIHTPLLDQWKHDTTSIRPPVMSPREMSSGLKIKKTSQNICRFKNLTTTLLILV